MLRGSIWALWEMRAVFSFSSLGEEGRQGRLGSGWGGGVFAENRPPGQKRGGQKRRGE